MELLFVSGLMFLPVIGLAIVAMCQPGAWDPPGTAKAPPMSRAMLYIA